MVNIFYGTDIVLNENGNFITVANGDIDTVTNLDCLIQDIRNEILTYPGDLFYDLQYGYGLLDFIHRQGTDLDRLELLQRMKDRLSKHELIDIESIKVNIIGWDMNKIGLFILFNVDGQRVNLKIDITSIRISVEVVNI